MILILLAIFIVGYFEPGMNEDEIYDRKALELVFVYGFSSALSFSLEVLLMRWHSFRGVSAVSGGFLTLLFYGIYGIILLIIIGTVGG